MDVTVRKFVTGPLETNTYVVSGSDRDALVFDPSSGCRAVVEYIRSGALAVKAIVLTHGHFDHILGIPEIQQHYDVPVWVHPSEKVLLAQSGLNGSDIMGLSYYYAGSVQELREGEMSFGSVVTEVVHVPGHSPGGCAFLFDGAALVGDVLFAGSVGRVDLPGGDGPTLIQSIREKLLALPAETTVYPGHGNRTTIGREARTNPFLREGAGLF